MAGLSKVTQAHKLSLGAEDKFKNTEFTPGTLIRALNFMNYFYEADDSKKFTIDWVKSITKTERNPAEKEILIKTAKKLSEVKEYNFRTLGWVCRLIILGNKLPSHSYEFRDRRIKELVDSVGGLDEEKKEKSKNTGMTAAEKYRDHVSEVIGDLDGELDKFCSNLKEASTFQPYEYLTSKNLNQTTLKEIIAYYKPIHAEISEAITSPDAQLKEAYRSYKKSELKRMLDFVANIMIDCSGVMDHISSVVKPTKSKKPRKKKVKTPEQISSKVKYMASSDKYGVSINPKDIVKASQLWVFNTKTRVLASYISSGVDGLSVKGSTIINFDDKQSTQKKLRKPEQTLKEVMEGGKITLRKIMDSLKSVPSVPKGRINKDMILLRTVR